MRIIRFLMPVAALLILISCSKPDKTQQLAELKKQQADIAAQIIQLEKELAASGAQGTAENADVKPVETVVIGTAPFRHFIEVQGTVSADDEIFVASESAGSIKKLLVKEGDVVKSGQILAEIDSDILNKTLEEVETGYDLAKTVYERQKRLWEQKVGSEIQYLQARNNKESLEKRMETLKKQIDMTKVKAPISGTVEEVPVKLGQLVMPGSPIAHVMNFSRVKVKAEVAEAYSVKIKPGINVLVGFPDIGKEVDSKISFAGKSINPVNRTFLVEVRLNQGEIEYRNNMVSVIKINDYINPKAVAVPENYIQTSKTGQYVYVAEKSGEQFQAKRRAVTSGMSYNGITEITSGLNEGDRVISKGIQTLMEGQAISFK